MLCVSGKGDVFGELFWEHSATGQSSANVRALTYCDIHSIRNDKLSEVLDFYMAFANSFKRNLTLTYNIRERVSGTLSFVMAERSIALCTIVDRLIYFYSV